LIHTKKTWSLTWHAHHCRFAILAAYENTINTWAEPRSAEGVTANTVIDSNDEVRHTSAENCLFCPFIHSWHTLDLYLTPFLRWQPPQNNQQRMTVRGY